MTETKSKSFWSKPGITGMLVLALLLLTGGYIAVTGYIFKGLLSTTIGFFGKFIGCGYDYFVALW